LNYFFFKHHRPTLIKRQAFFEKRQMRHDFLIADLELRIRELIFKEILVKI
jgi:hypothetical protein